MSEVEGLRRMAEAAQAAARPDEAAAHYGTAMALLGPGGPAEAAFELGLERARCLHRAGDYSGEMAALGALARLAERIGDGRRGAQVELSRAALLLVQGDVGAGMAVASRLAEGAADGDQQLRARAMLIQAEAHYSLSDYEASQATARAVVAEARAAGDGWGEAHGLRWVGLAMTGAGRAEQGRAFLLEALDRCRAIGDREGEAWALNALGIGTLDLALARFYYEQALTIMAAIGERESQVTIANNLGVIYSALGLYRQSAAYGQQAVAGARAIGAQYLLGIALDTLGRALWQMDGMDEARAAFAEGRALLETVGDRSAATHCRLGLARVALAEGDALAARAELAASVETFGDLGAEGDRAIALAWLGAACLACDDQPAALAATAAAVAIVGQGHTSTEYPSQEVWWWRYQALAATPDADPAEAWACLEQARAAVLEGVETLGDAGLRRCYLCRVTINREIIETWARLAIDQGIAPAPDESPAARLGLEEQLTRMLAVSARLNEIRDVRALRERLLDEAVELCGAERIALITADEAGPRAVAMARGAPASYDDVTEQAGDLLEEAERARQPSLRDVPPRPGEGWPEDPPALRARRCALVPLVARGRLVGLLYADGRALFGPLAPADLKLLSLLASQAATAIENARLYGETLRAKADLERRVAARTADLRTANAALARRAAEAQQAHADAEAASQAKSLFLANMSHELRTPLNAILGFAQLLSRAPNLDGDQREHLEVITRSGAHLLTLINDVLEVSRIEAGRLDLNPAPFDLRGLLSDLERLFRARAEGRTIELRFIVGPGVPRVAIGDASRLRQILINLLGNALKFTPRGSVTLRAEARPRPQGLRLTVDVVDTGVGIAEQEIDGLFQPFAQSESGRRAQEGTGLGLAISRRIARLMGGDIRVRSAVGRGSTFTCEVLLEEAPPETALPASAPRRVVSLDAGPRPYRILVADDRPENRRLLTAWLSGAGLDVREAADGEEALAACAEWGPDLVLMDMRMPVLDGFGATERLKAAPGAPPVIAVTASALPSEQARIRAAGCDAILHKPVSEQDLLEAVAHHLGLRLRYDEAHDPGAAAPPGLSAEDLEALPDDLRSQLAAAARAGDVEQIEAVIAAARPAAPAVAEALAQLAAEFCLEQIEALAAPAG